MRRGVISAWTQGSSSTGQSLRRVAIFYSSFQSWFSVNSSLMNSSFFPFFFACCIHIPSKITLPRWGILVCECRDLIYLRMKWASSWLSLLCSYERLLQGFWSSNKNSSCIFVGSGPVSNTQYTQLHTLCSLMQVWNTLAHIQPSYCSMFKLNHIVPLSSADLLL